MSKAVRIAKSKVQKIEQRASNRPAGFYAIRGANNSLDIDVQPAYWCGQFWHILDWECPFNDNASIVVVAELNIPL